MSSPYGITQVDVPGALNVLEQARSNRIRQMLLQRQMEQEDRTADRNERFQSVLARAYGGAQGGKTAESGSSAPPTGMAAAYAQPASPPTAATPVTPQATPAPAAPGLSPEIMRELLAIDPQQAAQIQTAVSRMDEAQLARAGRANEAMARLGQHLLSNVPEAEWPAEIQRRAADLAAHGVTQEQIAGFQPTRQNVQYVIAQARDIEKIIEDARPRLREVAGQVIDERALPAGTPEDPVVFESEFVPGPQGTMYRRRDFAEGGQRSAPSQTPDQLRAAAAEAIRNGADPARVNARLNQMLQGGAGRPQAPGTFRGRPVADGGSAVRSVFPQARITEVRRPAASRLGRANPGSYHVRSGGAVDIAPIPGMTFGQYIQGLRGAGYRIIEQRDEVNNPSSHATGPHWHVVIGEGP